MALFSWVNKKIKKHYDWKMVAATESYGFFFGLFTAGLFPILVIHVNPYIYGFLFLLSISYPMFVWIFKK